MTSGTSLAVQEILETAQQLRAQVGVDFHEKLVESVYTDAAYLADRAVQRAGQPPRFDMDRT
ncbi:MAG TPA: hypothetical protein DCY42_02580, partial [Chloroflexi bacterium]|nr:hypothetical protein [Chloroflexota bacterium]